jgi:methionyl-tRNA formyltransferase
MKKTVILVGGAAIGLGFLQKLESAHRSGICDLLGAIPGHKSEAINPIISRYACERGIKVAMRLPEFPAPDIIVSAGNHIIFTPEQLSKSLVINLHAAPLPEYAGSAAMSWAILNDAKEFGVTFHYASEILDGGEYFHFESFPIDSDMTAGDIDRRCTEVAIDTFGRNLSKFLNPLPTKRIPKGTRPPYKRTELEPFREIDLSWPPEKIWKHIRAFDCDGILKPAFVRVAGHEVYLTARSRGTWI